MLGGCKILGAKEGRWGTSPALTNGSREWGGDDSESTKKAGEILYREPRGEFEFLCTWSKSNSPLSWVSSRAEEGWAYAKYAWRQSCGVWPSSSAILLQSKLCFSTQAKNLGDCWAQVTKGVCGYFFFTGQSSPTEFRWLSPLDKVVAANTVEFCTWRCVH